MNHPEPLSAPTTAPVRQCSCDIAGARIQCHEVQITLQRLGLFFISAGIGGGVSLGEEDDRVGAGLIGQRKVALQACKIEIGIARCDDEKLSQSTRA